MKSGNFRNWRLVGVLLFLAGLAASTVRAENPQNWRWTGIERVVSIGDVHGAYESVVELLEATGLISQDLRWVGGTTHLVMLGDLVDRGPRSRDVLDLLMRLQEEAPITGGMVHVVLGNHEVMNLVGDYRYVSGEEFAAFASQEDFRDRNDSFIRVYGDKDEESPDFQTDKDQFDRDFPPGYFGHRRAFSQEGEYGRWLLEQPILVVINETVYLHGGLAPCLAEIETDKINVRAQEELRQFLAAKDILLDGGVLVPEARLSQQHALASQYLEKVSPNSTPQTLRRHKAAQVFVNLAESALTMRPDGPLWYRGTSLNPAEEEIVVATRILGHLEANRVVVGHTPNHTGRVSVRLDGMVVRADTGMLTSHYKGQAAAVIQQNGLLLAFYPGEMAIALSQTAVEGSEAGELRSAELESVLREADVVSMEAVGSGSSQPFLLTLAHDGGLFRGVFKTNPPASRDTINDGEALPVTDESHRYQHEIAAYRISSMVGFDLVPVTVAREINGRQGSLQLWVENAVNAANIEDADLRPPDAADFERQENLVALFDALILNDNRDPTSILVTTQDWRVRLIDQSPAFALETDSNALLVGGNLPLDPVLADRLRSLDAETLRLALEDLLSDDQIDAFLTRRDRIVGNDEGRPFDHEPDAKLVQGD